MTKCSSSTCGLYHCEYCMMGDSEMHCCDLMGCMNAYCGRYGPPSCSDEALVDINLPPGHHDTVLRVCRDCAAAVASGSKTLILEDEWWRLK